MTPLRGEDLPAHVRTRLEQSAADMKTPTLRDRSQAKTAGPAYTCHACGARFARYGAAAERHALTPGHSRLNMTITQAN